MKKVFLTLLCCFISVIAFPQSKSSSTRKIIIIAHFTMTTAPKTVKITVGNAENLVFFENERDLSTNVINGTARFEIVTQTNLLVINEQIFGTGWQLLERGDSIVVDITQNNRRYSGKGSGKAKLLNKIANLTTDIHPPTDSVYYRIKTFEGYSMWSDAINRKLEVEDSLLTVFKNSLSPYAFTYLKAQIYSNDEYIRLFAFNSYYSQSHDAPEIIDKLENTFDKSFNNKYTFWLKSYKNSGGNPLYYYLYSVLKTHRTQGFKKFSRNVTSSEKRKKQYFYSANQSFAGEGREKALAYLLTNEGVKEHGLSSTMEELLSLYYSDHNYPNYKKFVKAYVDKTLTLKNGQSAPNLLLYDNNNKIIDLAVKLKDKVVLIDFWFTGCTGCIGITPLLAQVENTFKNDSNVVFLNISIDKKREIWQKSIEQKKFTTGLGLNLYTGGYGANSQTIKDFNVQSYPTLFLIDVYGKIAETGSLDPRKIKVDSLVKILKKELKKLPEKKVKKFDGPYIISQNAEKYEYIINGNNVSKRALKGDEFLTIKTDSLNVSFQLKLNKDDYDNEPSVFESVTKIFAVSDIEGNFDAFRKLLQNNGVIDRSFRWIFKNGHLVINGDLFDRGEQVTECLWLIYYLEQQAKIAGGYVHFILGNHEIMNLQGDHKYAKEKYKASAALIGTRLNEIYSTNTELGRWLRTKNIVEKIGNILFCHAGISREVNNLSLSISDINKIARSNYSSFQKNSLNTSVDVIMNNKSGPFWYRDYYLETPVKKISTGEIYYRAANSTIDSTLAIYTVSHIVTGHTIVSDTVSQHFQSKIINTDTRHADGKSEGLLILDDKFYRVNDKGQQWLLFDDRKVKK